MVLESLFDTKAIMKHPVVMIILSLIIGSVSLWASYLIFPDYTSILSVAFVVIALVPLIHYVFIYEEEEEVINIVHTNSLGGNFLGRHFEIIKIYAFFFIGLVLSYMLWYAVLPVNAETVCIIGNCIDVPAKTTAFAEQEKTLLGIQSLRGNVTGQAIANVSGSNFWNVFGLIFANNLYVMILAVIFSFLFGAGALFLIGWNASVIGVLLGQQLLNSNHFAFLGLLPHGIPEIVGYFIAAIAGGLISIIISKKKYIKGEIPIITSDIIAMLALGIFSLLIGALIEAFLITKQGIIGLTLSIAYMLLIAILILKGANFRK